MRTFAEFSRYVTLPPLTIPSPHPDAGRSFGVYQACFNEALQACAEGGGRFERAASFLEEMKEAGLYPDNVSYSAALLACERSDT